MVTLRNTKGISSVGEVTERLFAVEECVRVWRPETLKGHFYCSLLFTDNRIILLDREKYNTKADMISAEALGCILGHALSSVVLDVLMHDVPTVETGIEVQSSELNRVIEHSDKSFSVLYSDVLKGILQKGGFFGELSLVLQTSKGGIIIKGLNVEGLASPLSSLMKGKLEVKI